MDLTDFDFSPLRWPEELFLWEGGRRIAAQKSNESFSKHGDRLVCGGIRGW